MMHSNRYSSVKRKTYLLLDPSVSESVWDSVADGAVVFLIILNIIAVILETVESLYLPYRAIFDTFETFSVATFSVEYLLRAWSCTCSEKYGSPVKGRLRYLLSVGSLIDLLAITPFFFSVAAYDFRFVRIFRLIRFLRFFKLGRYLNASRIISRVFKSKRDELALCLIITLCLITVASCTMYFIEHDRQPDKFSSIPETMWWSVTTLTTVGYGDVYPVTAPGRILTACISIFGIGMFALPAGILASGFSSEFQKLKRKKYTCPHCGENINL